MPDPGTIAAQDQLDAMSDHAMSAAKEVMDEFGGVKDYPRSAEMASQIRRVFMAWLACGNTLQCRHHPSENLSEPAFWLADHPALMCQPCTLYTRLEDIASGRRPGCNLCGAHPDRLGTGVISLPGNAEIQMPSVMIMLHFCPSCSGAAGNG